jgi:hypothetical protein
MAVEGRCLGTEPGCTPFQLTNDDSANKYINSIVNEGLNIGGAVLHIFKLLGIHEQNMLIDLTGLGNPIASGEYPQFPTANAFIHNIAEWRSVQKGALVTASAFIGYDFGEIKLDNNRVRYGIETEVKYHITSILIQQGCDNINRVKSARVERSNDGIKWFGVAIITIPDDELEHWIDIKQSAPSRYWRIRPLSFNGGATDYWSVRKLSLSEYLKTNITNVQDEMGFMENRDRSYSTDPITVKGYYDIMDVQTDLTRFGYDFNDNYNFKIGFDSLIRLLGRPIVVGDIIELPSEIQYDINLNAVKKYLEVTDVSWAASGFTPGYQPTLYTVVAQPVIASQETMDIIGDLNTPSSDNEFFDMLKDHYSTDQMKGDIKGRAEADTEVPEKGIDTADELVLPDNMLLKAAKKRIGLVKLSPNSHSPFVEDGMPPNGAPFTEGPVLPVGGNDGDYHRLTYINVPDPIPTRLYKFSSVKNRWLFMEEDKRMRANSVKPQYDMFLTSTGVSPDKIR